nr:MAG TPA: hypothetical protein [Caudoviricetes sp.]
MYALIILFLFIHFYSYILLLIYNTISCDCQLYIIFYS